MIQRLLRGRWLYPTLLTLIILMYVYGLQFKAPPLPETGEAPSVSEQEIVWWPKQLDATTLQRFVEQDPIFATALSIFSVLLVVVGIWGVALTVWSLWGTWLPRSAARAGRGGPRSARHERRRGWLLGSHRLAPWSFGDVGRVVVLTLMVASLLPFAHLAIASFRLEAPPDPHLWITESMLFLDCFVILPILMFASSKRRSAQRVFGLRVHRPLATIAEALRSYVTAFPWLFLLLFAIIEFIKRLGWTPPAEPIQELIFGEHRRSVLILTGILACVVGPFAEELFFRGLLYTAIRQRASRLMAMLGSGATFALIHMNPVGFLPIMALGCLLAYLYERTGSLLAPLTVHILHNTILMSFAFVLKRLLSLT